MSYEILTVYPKLVGLVPNRAAISGALALLADLTLAGDVEARETEHLEFVDAGENTGRIGCGRCGALAEPSWWADQMTASHRSHFVERSIDMPCCGAESTLDALRYEANEGFARFQLRAREPQSRLTSSMQAQLEARLGCAVAIVLAHY